MSELKEKTAKGLLWGGFSNCLQQLLNLCFGIFLARLLTPADYGLVGMLSIFALIATALQESGFTAALARQKEFRHEQYNAVFWFSTLTGATLYLILFCCAPLIAEFFHEPRLTPLARYSFLSFLISSTGIAHNAYIFRHLMVKQNALMTLASLFLSGLVGVGMAWHGMAYWGIATQSLVYVSALTLQRWIFSTWRPTMHINLRPLRPMLGFSLKLLATTICQHINYNLLTVVLGRFYTPREVGFFNQGNKWNYMGYSVILGMVQGVAQPVLCNVADDRERQLRVFRKMLRFTAFVSFPALFGLSLVAPEFITIAITDKWKESAALLQLLCLGSAFAPIQHLYTNLVISKGRSDKYLVSVVCQGAVQTATALLCYPLGIHTMVACYAGIQIVWTLVWHALAWREVGISLWQALQDVMPFLLIAAGVMGATHYLVPLLTTHLYLLLMGKIVLATLLYAGILWLCKAKVLQESIHYLIHKKV